jgi:hypothetical protein
MHYEHHGEVVLSEANKNKVKLENERHETFLEDTPSEKA